MKKYTRERFEQNFYSAEQEPEIRTAQLAMTLGTLSMEFSHIERAPRYDDGRRENDAEHSFMLALVAPEIIDALGLPLDKGLAAQYATVHDLIELKTLDQPTLLFTEDQQLQKELNEQAALRELLDELPPHTSKMLLQYEHQSDPESRFVRYIDKLLPLVIDSVGCGAKVMKEVYDITSVEQLQECHDKLHVRLVQKFGNEFSEIDLAHQLLCEMFETCFAQEV